MSCHTEASGHWFRCAYLAAVRRGIHFFDLPAAFLPAVLDGEVAFLSAADRFL